LLEVQVNPVTDVPAALSAWMVRVSPTDMLQKTRLSRLPLRPSVRPLFSSSSAIVRAEAEAEVRDTSEKRRGAA
jgi:hypothetical protein